MKLHSTFSLSIDSDYSFGDSSAVTVTPGQSEQSDPVTPEEEDGSTGKMDVVVEWSKYL